MMKVLVITDELMHTDRAFLDNNYNGVKELDLSDEAIEEMALEKYPVKMKLISMVNFDQEMDINSVYRHIFTESLKHLREKL